MYYNSDIHHRHTIRLKGYDYSKSGFYFVTICTKNREMILGEIKDGKMLLSEYGIIAEEILEKTQRNLKNKIRIESYIIMPNHLHLIIELKYDNKIKLNQIIRKYKSLVSKYIRKNEIIEIWQRNYYEHIIRNEKELFVIREYIQNNPQRWEADSLYNIK